MRPILKREYVTFNNGAEENAVTFFVMENGMFLIETCVKHFGIGHTTTALVERPGALLEALKEAVEIWENLELSEEPEDDLCDCLRDNTWQKCTKCGQRICQDCEEIHICMWG